MPSISHQNVPDEERRATQETAVKPQGQVKLGSLLAEIGRKAGLTDEEFAAFESGQDRTPSRAAKNQPLNDAELEAHEAQRDLASELLQSIQEMKAGAVLAVVGK